MNQPTTFIFDYGNVISIVDPGIFWNRVKGLLTGTLSTEERLANAREILNRYETGLMHTDEFLSEFMHRTGLAMPRADFIKAWSEFFIPILYTRKLIRAVKRTSKVGLLSNTNPLHFDHVIKPTDIYPLFDAVSLSHEVGTMKPDQKPFLDILAKLGSKPEECVYFDDLSENISTAKALGMQTIHVRSEDQLASDVHAAFPWIEVV